MARREGHDANSGAQTWRFNSPLIKPLIILAMTSIRPRRLEWQPSSRNPLRRASSSNGTHSWAEPRATMKKFFRSALSRIARSPPPDWSQSRGPRLNWCDQEVVAPWKGRREVRDLIGEVHGLLIDFQVLEHESHGRSGTEQVSRGAGEQGSRGAGEQGYLSTACGS